eukprot:TRINITY_DN10253_c0_g1_i2.p1 TRINITY_DN10253_c0_g1~~TRINITY_DN10253_c0_g1_i2.p1  ORF type:complete len:191 (-),score=28.39 TRINITY_DN10253_c0_g1_i2:36-608(-)
MRNRLPDVPATLRDEDIQKFFPFHSRKDITASIDQATCSICLEDFTPISVCRKLFCEHIFHKLCIDTWLKAKETCPNCNRPFNKQKIKEYLEGKKNGSPTLSYANPPHQEISPLQIHLENHDHHDQNPEDQLLQIRETRPPQQQQEENQDRVDEGEEVERNQAVLQEAPTIPQEGTNLMPNNENHEQNGN